MKNIAHRRRLRPRGSGSPTPGLGLLTACAILVPNAASAQDAEQRIRELEEQVRAITEELRILREQVQAAPPSAPGGTQPSPVAEPAAATARQAADAAAEAKERVTALEQRVDQQGIQARLADGLLLEDPQNRWRLRFTGRALADYRAFSPDVIASDTFSVRQARLGMNLTFMRDWSIYVEGEYSGTASNSNVILSNAYVDWQVMPSTLRLRFGQFKPLFGLEHTDRVPYFDFTERGLPAGLIQNFLFDRGVMALGSPTKGLYYGVSLTNGSGQNIDERQSNATETRADGKDFTARLAFNLAQAMDWRDLIVQVGGSYKDGTQANSVSNPYSAASITTEGRGVSFFTPQAFNPSSGPAQVGEIERRLYGLEAILARGPVKLQGEYLSARYSGERIAAPVGGFERDLSGYYVSAMWLITGERYADAYRDSIIARIRPRNNFSWKDGTWGAWELGLRYSTFDGSDFSTGNPDFTGRPSTSSTALVQTVATEAQAYTFGIKWLPNPYVRFLFNYIRTEFDEDIVVGGERIGHEDAINLRAQLDFF
jgi:phosphate-selective porin OprO/OprP